MFLDNKKRQPREQSVFSRKKKQMSYNQVYTRHENTNIDIYLKIEESRALFREQSNQYAMDQPQPLSSQLLMLTEMSVKTMFFLYDNTKRDQLSM